MKYPPAVVGTVRPTLRGRCPYSGGDSEVTLTQPTGREMHACPLRW